MGRKAAYENRKKYLEFSTRRDVLEYADKSKKTNIVKKKNFANNIIGEYLNIMMQGVLDGYKIEFPGLFTIQIVREKAKEKRFWPMGNKITNGKQFYMYNPNRPDNYFFLIEGTLVKKYRLKLRVTDKWRSKLNVILMTTDKQYPMYEHPKKS